MEEIKLNMENLSAKEREQLMNLVEKANKKDPNIPKEGSTYYCINADGMVAKLKWRSLKTDNWLYDMGNCFRTEQDAKFAVEQHKVVVELERFARRYNGNPFPYYYYLTCDYNDSGYYVSTTGLNTMRLHGVSFTSKEMAQKAIEVIGEDRLKKYYFGVE